MLRSDLQFNLFQPNFEKKVMVLFVIEPRKDFVKRRPDGDFTTHFVVRRSFDRKCDGNYAFYLRNAWLKK